MTGVQIGPLVDLDVPNALASHGNPRKETPCNSPGMPVRRYSFPRRAFAG